MPNLFEHILTDDASKGLRPLACYAEPRGGTDDKPKATELAWIAKARRKRPKVKRS